MNELQFRIIVVPQKDLQPLERVRLLSQLKDTLQLCGLIDVSVSFSQVRKSEDEDDYPEIEELVVQVQAKSKTINQTRKSLLYQEFCSKWKNQFYSLPCTYIEIYSNDFFMRPKTSAHNLQYINIAFGVLPHNGIFYQFSKLLLSSHCNVDFYHDTRNLIINYNHDSNFQISFSYENIRAIFINIESKPCEMYLDLFNPPIIYRIEKGRYYDLKYRNQNIMPVLTEVDLDDYLSSFLLGDEFLESSSFQCNPQIDPDVLGRSNVLRLTFSDSEKVLEIVSCIHYRCSEKSVYFSKITSVKKTKPVDPVIEHMHFGCTYLLTAIFKRNFMIISQAVDINDSLKRLHFLSQQNPYSLEKALTSVLAALDSGKILNFWLAIERQYVHYTSNKDEISFKDYIVPRNCCPIRRVMLTPTRQLLWSPEIMYGNRILRNFDPDFALRVSFRDDNMSRISYNAYRSDSNFLESCIKTPMTNGLRIGSRKYEFLAWSNSQIRDHGVWMYARDNKGNTAAHIRQSMGDFSHIRNVPKYMARMGQCFSQTEDPLGIPLDSVHVRYERDIEGGWDRANGKPYCFSDGVGRISKQLAAKVHQALGHDRLCSAFQIRYAGCKGMLVIDPTLNGEQIVFRESMKKFDCTSRRLEIAKTSGPVALQLNRPFVTLLDGLGVRHRMFLRLQETVLHTLTAILYEENEAAKFLQSKTPSDFYDYHEMSRSGIHLTTEPFFKTILLALHRHHIEKIKSRANIMLDPDKGRNMLGVLDETGILNYGQVFVQYTRDISFGETTKDTVVHRGQVLVTKNPCMHPGDVRKFQAVDVPQLRHIVDCIVFPQRGQRPHPNEMAGSDLDGDEYSVLWSPDLIFYAANHEPADFPAAHSPDVPSVKVSHMIQFLQDYIKNDNVGSIANAHLAHADNSGIRSKICLDIAKKFSIAVDFAKNGQSQQLSREERPKMYPDFMEKYFGEVYESENALGQMYRVCKDFESENEAMSINYENVQVDPDLVYDGWEVYKDSAIKSRNKFNALLRSVLRNYGVQHEAEALSGAFTHLHCRFHERKDRNEIEKVILGCLKKLNKCMVDEFKEEFLVSGDINRVLNNMLQKASAWYIVTYSDPNAKFLSFPWAVSEYLIQIKARRTLAKTSLFSPAIMNLNQVIAECYAKNLLPQFVETGIWNEYYIECNDEILKQALRTLILWAEDVDVIEKPGQNTRGLMFVSVFIRLFFHVAEAQGYVTNKSTQRIKLRSDFSAGHLCLEFLKFCSSFRFYRRTEMEEILNFSVKFKNQLATRAIVAYHKFALTGKLQSLEFDKKIDQEFITMKPIMIESKIFTRSPIDLNSLKLAEAALMKYSEVQWINLRENRQTKKVCVSATGSELALKELKRILRMKHAILRSLFTNGILPETD